MTPVFGTAQPVGGPSAAIRESAYARPAHDPLHWLLLLGADRLDIGGTLARETVTPGKQGAVVRHYARQARAYPVNSAIAAGVFGLGALLAVRGWRRG